jgi:hypothetical protein
MHKIMLTAAAATLLSSAAFAQTTSWQYGAGNGDPMKPSGTPQSSFAYGGDNSAKGSMIQMGVPTPQPQQMASPTPAKSARPGSHS